MEKNILISKNQKKEKLDNDLIINYSLLHHPIKLKSKKDGKKDWIEKMDFVIKESEETTTPKKNSTKESNKDEANAINIIKDFTKQINIQKNFMLYPVNQKTNNEQKKSKNSIDSQSPKKISPIYYKTIQKSKKEKLMHKSKSNPIIINK